MMSLVATDEQKSYFDDKLCMNDKTLLSLSYGSRRNG